MMRFLITGAKGQVGASLVEQLTGKAEVTALDRAELDITDQAAVKKAIETVRPEVVINAAAYTAVDRAENEAAVAEAVNVAGVRYLAQATQSVGALLLHISTDYVFAGDDDGAYTENSPTAPQSVYGKTKLEGEQAALQANEKTIVLRTSWVFGERGNNFVKTMLRLGKERDALAVVSDQIGGPTYAGDIAAALIKIADEITSDRTDAFGIYHFSGRPYVSWYEFAQAVFTQADLQKILKKRPLVNKISSTDYPTLAKRPANSRLDLSKIKNTFGIEPSDWCKALENLKAYL